MDGGPAGLLAELADLVLPRTCAGCGRRGAVLCPACVRLLTRPHLASPRRFPPGFPPTVAAGAYAGAVRHAVISFKERGRAELARPLGAALALAVTGVLAGLPAPPAGPVLLVPLPSSAAAMRTRGRDHVRELARRARAELAAGGLPVAEARLLRRRGRVRDSAGLSVGDRRANLAGTFLARGAPEPAGAVLVLVDDVVTSGATLTEAAAVLSEGRGAADVPVLAAVVAATPRPGSGTVSEGSAKGARSRPTRPADRLSVPGAGD
ncbi:MAG: phosphoribosyltransferase [Frankiales bacterium]|nr:phosphoribosyltransferase [Frankiales bacterium]